ncbi:MAG TPA: biotin--[acetyl-CoA-carboxylase] ligase [Dongiaceae bacterium]|jgi:BirA family biotin operon repressor/biotin-[acetyl-CoA-carboxylase] ligase
MTGAVTLPPFFSLICRPSVASTNDEARALAETGAAEGTMVWGLEQTAGRGRRGRGWHSPPGNLYVSTILRPGKPAAEAALLGFVAAVALADALVDLGLPEDRLRLKWPNDVLVDRAKAAGILIETSAAMGQAPAWLVLGMGVNLVHAPADTPYPAITLRQAGLATLTVEGLLEALAGRLAEWYGRWQAAGFAPVREAWLRRAVGLGEPIEVRLERETLQGRFAALEEDGALILEQPAGGRRRVTVGDVFFRGTERGG